MKTLLVSRRMRAFQDASVGADEGFSLESDASGLAADARPAEASDM